MTRMLGLAGAAADASPAAHRIVSSATARMVMAVSLTDGASRLAPKGRYTVAQGVSPGFKTERRFSPNGAAHRSPGRQPWAPGRRHRVGPVSPRWGSGLGVTLN